MSTHHGPEHTEQHATPRDPVPGPGDSFELLLAEAGWVRALARRLAHDQAAAEDIAQGALTLALERRPEPRDGLGPWLAAVTRRLALRQRRGDVRRRERERVAALGRASAAPGSDVLLERLELQQQLANTVRALPEPYRGVLLRRYYEGLSAAEIARATGVSPATVRSQLARGLERLRQTCGARADIQSQGALACFVLAAGSDGGSIPRISAELFAMTTTKALAAAAAAALVLVGLISSPLFESSELPAGRETAADGSVVLDAPAGHGTAGVTPAREDSGRSAAVAVASSPPDTVEASSSVPEDEPVVTLVRARLVDDAGRGLPGSRLASIYSDGRLRGTHNVATADRAGFVELGIADEHMRAWREEVFPMVFTATGADRATSFVVSTPKLHGETDLGELVLGPAGALSGVVVDSLGRPMPSARLYAEQALVTADIEALRLTGPDPDVLRPRANADASGRFTLAGLVPGRSRLWVHVDGYLWTLSEAHEVVASTTLDLGSIQLEEVPPALRVTGLVLLPDGQPAAGAVVSYESQANQQEGQRSTDAAGRFVLIPAGKGALQLVARDPQGRFNLSALVEAAAGAEVTLELREKQVIGVRVTDAGGQPLAGVALMPFLIERASVFGDGGTPVPGEDWTRTGADGRAPQPVLAEPFEIVTSMRGYHAQRLGPYEPTGAPAMLEVVLESEPRIAGQVLAYGEPVGGVSIVIGEWIEGFVPLESGFPVRLFLNRYEGIVSDADGWFESPVDDEWTDIAVLARGSGYATGETQLTVAAGQGARGVVVDVTHGGSVAGTVLPPHGQSAAGFVVAASRGDGFPVWTRADKNGYYRLEGLAPGPWRVEGRDSEPTREVLSVANRPEDKQFNWNVDVVDGREVSFDVDMRGLGEVELHGTLTVDGAAESGWTAELILPRDKLQRRANPAVELSADGTYTLVAPAGRYDLRLAGTLEGGARVELLRELRLEGTRLERVDELVTAMLDEPAGGDFPELRLVRGHFSRGDREVTLVRISEDGRFLGRVPAGRSSLQVSAGESALGAAAWRAVRELDL